MTDTNNIEEMYTDLESHHIEGIAAHGYTRFSVPLITPIDEDFWQGGCKDGVELPHDFDLVVSLYPWEKYKLSPDTKRIEIRAYNAHNVPDVTEAVNAVHKAIMAKQKVLVHCQAGLNRSGLVAGMVLIKMGLPPKQAIKLLRASRCEAVLCNKTFEEYLHSLKVGL